MKTLGCILPGDGQQRSSARGPAIPTTAAAETRLSDASHTAEQVARRPSSADWAIEAVAHSLVAALANSSAWAAVLQEGLGQAAANASESPDRRRLTGEEGGGAIGLNLERRDNKEHGLEYEAVQVLFALLYIHCNFKAF